MGVNIERCRGTVIDAVFSQNFDVEIELDEEEVGRAKGRKH